MSSVSGGEFKARRRREKKMKKEKWMEMKKKMKMMEAEMYERVLKSQDFGASRPVTKALTMEKAAASGTNEKLRFYNPNTPLPRPQDVYHIKVDNTNKPFKHVLLEKSPDIVADNTSEPFKHALLEKSPDIVVDNTNESFEQALLEKSPDDDARPTHPLEKLPVEQLFDRRVPENLPLKPPELSDTIFTFVENRKALNKLASKLKDATEFAVNIEHNHNRSFQGLTCLMQISTRTEDFIVDTLKLRKYLGEKLREVFQDPTKKKVMHGAGPDITWLQRDFGIYICNLFDIAQASRILRIGYNCKSVTHLLHQFCGVRQRKRYRSADWRRRPLPSGMIEYAREVTHYLLYIYDLMRLKLVNESSGEDDLLLEVCKCSNRICLQLYEKELLTDSSYLYTHGLKANELSARQLSVLAGLYQWRDSVARAEDESTAYILPDKTLLEIAKQTPVTARRLKRTVVSKNKFLEHHLGHVISIVRNAVANSDAFENIAQQLKNERLEELTVEDAKSSSEDTEMITAVDADNNGSNSHLSDEPAVVPGFSNKQGHVSRGPFFTFIVDGSLDYFAICGTLNKVLKWKGFDQLTILIKYSIIPFIKRCPEELWPKLVDEVLYPVFNYFRVKLSNSWRKLLRDGSVQVPDRTPSLSKEDAYKYGSSLIIQLTRAASELLAVIASPVLNGSCSRSLAGYILCRDVPMLPMLSLIHHIFGEWNDDEAKMTLVPFCYEVIHVASAEHLDDAVSFIEDGVIPHLIQCLAFKTLKSTQLDVLRELCRKAFHCVQNSNQGLMSAEKHNESIVFESWLREEISHTNAPSHELGQLVWIWEMEEEFMEYIAAYIDMLQEVNEMEDCLDYDYSSPWDLFDELKPDFKSKYGIDSASHDYVWTMSAMLSRKASAMHWERRNAEMFRFFCELIDFKPYIQHSSYDDSVMELVRNSERYPGLAEFLRVSALEEFREMLMLWEPQFHPMIRKGHKHVLREILDHSTYMENITYLQPLQPDIGDFPVHLVPYATNYIGSMNKMYHMAKEQANLHEKFDAHLASGALDQYICKDDALKVVRDDDLLPTQFSVLDHDLIKLSFERRAKFLDMQCQLHSFYKGVQDAINDEQLRIVLQSLIVKLKDQGFFDIADDATDSDNECFSELVDEFKKQVFARLRLPDYYVIRGIMDYRAMSLEIEGSSCSWPDAFEAVVGEAYRRWIRSSHLFWMDTRCYKHQYYDFIRQPFEKIWKKDPKKKDSEEGIKDPTVEYAVPLS